METYKKMLDTYYKKLGGRPDESLGWHATDSEVAVFERLLEIVYEDEDEGLPY